MNRQLTLFADVLPSAIGNVSLRNSLIEGGDPSLRKPLIEGDNPDLMRFLKRDKSEGGKGHVNRYRVPESKNYYYRFSYWIDKRVKHKHIRGGNTRSKLANERADIIRGMVNRDCATPDILKKIAEFGNTR